MVLTIHAWRAEFRFPERIHKPGPITCLCLWLWHCDRRVGGPQGMLYNQPSHNSELQVQWKTLSQRRRRRVTWCQTLTPHAHLHDHPCAHTSATHAHTCTHMHPHMPHTFSKRSSNTPRVFRVLLHMSITWILVTWNCLWIKTQRETNYGLLSRQVFSCARQWQGCMLWEAGALLGQAERSRGIFLRLLATVTFLLCKPRWSSVYNSVTAELTPF